MLLPQNGALLQATEARKSRNTEVTSVHASNQFPGLICSNLISVELDRCASIKHPKALE